MAKALQDFHLPPEIALGPNPAFYRAGQNQLIASLFVGNAQANGSAPDDLFKVTKVVNGADVAGTGRGERLQDDLADLTPHRDQRRGARPLPPPHSSRAPEPPRMTQVVLFNVFNGLIVGAFYALMALGLSLILNLSGVINFAHGGFLALGAYLAYTLMPYIGFWGALIVAPLLTAALGLVVERVLIRPLYGSDPLYGLLLTFGLAYIFEDGTRFIWGAQSLPFQVPVWLQTSLSSQFFFLTGYRVFMVVIVVAAVGGIVRRAQLHPPRHAHPRRHARSRHGLDARRQRARCCAASISASASTSPASPACWRRACSGCRRRSAPRSSCRASSRSSSAASAACSARCSAAF